VLIVNTEGTEALYKSHYPEWQDKIAYIPNGFDVLRPVRKQDRQRFRIMHVGNFYGSRGPDALLEALAEIADPTIEFVQVGLPTPALQAATKVNIRVIPSVPRDRALELMDEASLLYLKQGFEAGDNTIYVSVAAKTYEYLATGLPILADCPPGDNADVVQKYCAHPYVVTSGSPSDLRAAILTAHARHATMKPQVTAEFVERFDRVRLTARLAGLFDQLARPSLAPR
jgi:glycosyltransferase involved in cell wall biosynthesis